MTESTPERKLAAIFVADVVGYSRLMAAEEVTTLDRLKFLRGSVFEPQIAAHNGRIVKLMGDGILAEFPSAVEALACAVEVQRGVAALNADSPEKKQIRFRVGINVGDIIVDDDDIYGDGVNVAARLEGLADPGGICVSQMVRDGVGNRVPLVFEDMGKRQIKNIAEPVHSYRVRVENDAVMPTVGRRPSQRSPKWLKRCQTRAAIASIAILGLTP